MMKLIRFASVFSLLLVSSTVSLSVGAAGQTGFVKSVFVQQNEVILLTIDPPMMLTACATTDRFAFNVADAKGKAWYAMILTASALSRSVQVVGKDTCITHPDAEDVRYMQLFDQ